MPAWLKAGGKSIGDGVLGPPREHQPRRQQIV